jgi:aspartate ammonia-lyase
MLAGQFMKPASARPAARRVSERIETRSNGCTRYRSAAPRWGTGTNTKRGYARLAVRRLAAITSLKLRASKERVALQQSLGDFLALSAALRGLAVELSKIGNDLRLLGSGPHTGLYELELPALQPGSAIMPYVAYALREDEGPPAGFNPET